MDLGSRVRLENEDDLIWYPSEVNTSIRPGWFYHQTEDEQVKTLEELIHIYEHSVGGNATFLLNIPPTTKGLIHINDVNRLKELGDYIQHTYSDNLLSQAKIYIDKNQEIDCAKKDGYGCLCHTKEGETTLELNISFPQKTKLSKVVLMENIEYSQRIEKFELWVKKDQHFERIYEGTTVGYKKIASFFQVETDLLSIRILDARVRIYLASIGVYR